MINNVLFRWTNIMPWWQSKWNILLVVSRRFIVFQLSPHICDKLLQTLLRLLVSLFVGLPRHMLVLFEFFHHAELSVTAISIIKFSSTFKARLRSCGIKDQKVHSGTKPALSVIWDDHWNLIERKSRPSFGDVHKWAFSKCLLRSPLHFLSNRRTHIEKVHNI